MQNTSNKSLIKYYKKFNDNNFFKLALINWFNLQIDYFSKKKINIDHFIEHLDKAINELALGNETLQAIFNVNLNETLINLEDFINVSYFTDENVQPVFDFSEVKYAFKKGYSKNCIKRRFGSKL